MLSFKNKIFIDRVFGTVCAFILNYAMRLFNLIFNHDRKIPKNPKAIILAKIVGLGSILHSDVLCRTLKTAFPEALLIYVTSKGCKEFVANMHYVDEIFTIDDRTLLNLITSTIFVIYKMWQVKPDLYFDLELYSSWSSIVATFSLAKNRYGFFRKSTSFKFGLYTHLVFFNTNKYLSDIYLSFTNCIGISGNNSLRGLLNIARRGYGDCERLLEGLDIKGQEYVVVNTATSELLTERRWPRKKWQLFLDTASQIWPNLIFLVSGTESEKDYANLIYDSLSNNVQTNVKNIVGQISLSGYLALIEGCKAMVTCDSGPMHMAVSLGKPTLSIWGPGSPQHYANVTLNHKIIYEPIYCSPCLYHTDFPPCSGDNQCMKRIAVKKVLLEFASLLGISFPEASKFDALEEDEIYIQRESESKKALGLLQI